jgi:hypothetical protein
MSWVEVVRPEEITSVLLLDQLIYGSPYDIGQHELFQLPLRLDIQKKLTDVEPRRGDG